MFCSLANKHGPIMYVSNMHCIATKMENCSDWLPQLKTRIWRVPLRYPYKANNGTPGSVAASGLLLQIASTG